MCKTRCCDSGACCKQKSGTWLIFWLKNTLPKHNTTRLASVKRHSIIIIINLYPTQNQNLDEKRWRKIHTRTPLRGNTRENRSILPQKMRSLHREELIKHCCYLQKNYNSQNKDWDKIIDSMRTKRIGVGKLTTRH